jgi:hypothetical protein
MACSIRPWVSTSTWRFFPLIFCRYRNRVGPPTDFVRLVLAHNHRLRRLNAFLERLVREVALARKLLPCSSRNFGPVPFSPSIGSSHRVVCRCEIYRGAQSAAGCYGSHMSHPWKSVDLADDNIGSPVLVWLSPSYLSPIMRAKASDREARLSRAPISSRLRNSERQALCVVGLIGRRWGIGPVGHGRAG